MRTRHVLGSGVLLLVLGCMGPCGAPSPGGDSADGVHTPDVGEPSVGPAGEADAGPTPGEATIEEELGLPEALPPGEGWTEQTRSRSGDRIVYRGLGRSRADLEEAAEEAVARLPCATPVKRDQLAQLTAVGCRLEDGRHALITVRDDPEGGALWGVAAVDGHR